MLVRIRVGGLHGTRMGMYAPGAMGKNVRDGFDIEWKWYVPPSSPLYW